MSDETGLLRAFWKTTPTAPELDELAALIVTTLAALGEVDPVSYGGTWFKAVHTPSLAERAEVPITIDHVRSAIFKRYGQSWRDSPAGVSFYVWRTTTDGVDLDAQFSVGATSPWLKNTVVIGLPPAAMTSAALCRLLLQSLWDTCRPDIAEALNAAREPIFVLPS